jgi:hypothetical protein
MYTILVGNPGIGKGAAVNPALTILKEANTANVLSDRLTMEYVLEKLSKGFTSPTQLPGSGITFTTDASAMIFSPELSIFITASQITLPILTDLWDAREGDFDYGTRHKGSYKIHSPCISMLAGSTAEWLIGSIPASAVGGGFTRRVNFVYAKKKARSVPWPAINAAANWKQGLVNDLRHISALRGAIRLDTPARPLFERLYNDSDVDEFTDAATAGYVASRWAQTTKLAMVLSVAESDDLVVTKKHWEEAEARIEVVSKDIKMVFRGVGQSDLVQAADKVLRFLEMRAAANRSEIMQVMWQDCNSMELDVILATLEQGNLISVTYTGGRPVYTAASQIPKKAATAAGVRP